MAGIIDIAEPRAEVRISQTESCRLDRDRELARDCPTTIFSLPLSQDPISVGIRGKVTVLLDIY